MHAWRREVWTRGPLLVLLLMTSAPWVTAAEPAASTNMALTALCSRLLTRPADRVLLGQLRDSLRDLTDDASRYRYGVVYYLGCVATGNMPEAVRIRPQLQRLSGSLDFAFLKPEAFGGICPFCTKGEVTADCVGCQGTGNCPRCKGSGSTSFTGFDKKVERRTCALCKGMRVCCECQGQRRLTRTCKACGGLGYRVDTAEVRAAYLRLLGEASAAAPAVPPAEAPGSPSAAGRK